LLRELRSATRHAHWPQIHRLRAALDELPLRDELAIAVTAYDRDYYSLRASQWLVRLLVECDLGGLSTIGRLANLLQHIDRPAARMELAGLLAARARIDARTVLGIPVPPPPGTHEHLLDYLERLRQIGMLDAFSGYERAQKNVWTYDP
jgi:hypothetical protein